MGYFWKFIVALRFLFSSQLVIFVERPVRTDDLDFEMITFLDEFGSDEVVFISWQNAAFTCSTGRRRTSRGPGRP